MRQKLISLLGIGFALVMIILPGVFAYTGWGWTYLDPVYYLEHPWVMFGMVTAVFFAIIFYAVGRSIDNKQVSAVIALALALFISMTLTRRGYLYGYMGQEIGSWIIFVVILITVVLVGGFFIRMMNDFFWPVGSPVSVLIIWFFLRILDPEEFIPYTLLNDIFLGVYEFVTSIVGLIILIILAIIISFMTENLEDDAVILPRRRGMFGRKRR
jgi:hypothetical protein